MIRHYCDACGGAMDENNWAERWSPVLVMGGKQFKVAPTKVVTQDGESAELCRRCMAKLATEGAVS